jgi:hypothetical protein
MRELIRAFDFLPSYASDWAALGRLDKCELDELEDHLRRESGSSYYSGDPARRLLRLHGLEYLWEDLFSARRRT